MKHYALEHFHQGTLRLNCAQSVLYAYQKVSGDTAIALSDMKPFGGGRAPSGLCGALHAACTLAPAKADQLKSSFAALTGSAFCKEIKEAKYACASCVTTAAELLEGAMQ